jgi:hypothetical protein
MEHNHSHHENHEHQSKANMPTQKVGKFLPLIVIFGAVILFTGGMVLWQQRGDLLFIMRNFMAGFFLVFGFFKIINWKGFVSAYRMYDIVASRSTVYAYAYPIIELGLGFAYLFSINLFVTNIVTLLVMSLSAIGVAVELRKGQEIACACLGAVFKIPMTKVTLTEDLLMAGMALGMLVF